MALIPRGDRRSQPPRANAAAQWKVPVIRTRRETLTFRHPFRLAGIDRLVPAGAYDVVTDEELIEGLSFASFRRIATMITIPAAPPHQSSMEMIAVGATELADAQRNDAAAPSA